MPSWVYEVRITLDASIEESYGNWLAPHINEVLQKSGFLRAEWWKDQENPSCLWVIRYYASSQDQIHTYIQKYAPELRSQAVAKFGSLFGGERRVYCLNSTFGA